MQWVVQRFGQDFLSRLLVALLSAPIVLYIIWFGDWPYKLLIIVAGLIVFFELSAMARKYSWDSEQALFAYLTPFTYRFLGLLYVWAFVASLIWLRSESAAPVFLLISIVWSTDIGAYLVGRIVGGKKLLPAVSPNKTMSGAIGGLLAALICGVLLLVYFGMFDAIWLLIIVILSVAAQIGDLGQSWLKRIFDVKDSGRILPGHGGLFDRLDGLMLASMIFALGLFIVGYKF